jgi:hypothetical protein
MISALVLFTNVCTGIVAVPLVVTPVIPVGCVAVQLKVTPGVVLLKVIKAELLSEQMDCGTGENTTDGLGFTVMVKVPAGIGQPLAVAITEIVLTIALVPEFVGVNEGIEPVPVNADNPIAGLELVHVYVVPVTVFVNGIAVVAIPLQ